MLIKVHHIFDPTECKLHVLPSIVEGGPRRLVAFFPLDPTPDGSNGYRVTQWEEIEIMKLDGAS